MVLVCEMIVMLTISFPLLEVPGASASERVRGCAARGLSSRVRADVRAAAALGRSGSAQTAHAPAAPHLRRDRRETR